MNNAAIPSDPSAPEPLQALSAWLWAIMGGLRHALAALGGRDRAAVPMATLAWNRAGRLAQRFEALVAHLAAGSLPPPRVRAARVATVPRAAAVRLPRGFGWVARMMPDARCYAGQLQAMLADPAVVALLESCPRALRIVRPLRHMMGIPAPGARIRDPKPMVVKPVAVKPATAWWQVMTAVPAPVDYAPALSGRPPPGWPR